MADSPDGGDTAPNKLEWSKSENGTWSLSVDGKAIGHMDPIAGSIGYRARVEPGFKGSEIDGLTLADSQIGKKIMREHSGYDKRANAAQARHDRMTEAMKLRDQLSAKIAQQHKSGKDLDHER